MFEPWRLGGGGLGEYSLEAAKRYCVARAKEHYENFPVAFGVLGRDQMQAMAAVYAFARQADDFADEPCFRPYALSLLDVWEQELRGVFYGEREPRHPVFVALSWARERFGLEIGPLAALLSAFRQDVRKHRYETWDELLDYCSRSANPVGRLVLRILGLDEERLGTCSDAICTALQLTNFWQDLSVDRPRGRLYVPLELLRRHGLDEHALDHAPDDQVAALLRDLASRTFSLFWKGAPLVVRTPPPASLYFALVLAGGMLVLSAVALLGARALGSRPALGAGLLLPFVRDRLEEQG